MLGFKQIVLSDRAWMDEMLDNSGRGSLDYSFTTIFLWRRICRYQAARSSGCLLIRSETEEPSYLFPAGGGPLGPAVEALVREADGRGERLKIDAVLPEDKARLEALFPGGFEYILKRDFADYLYDTQSLMTLKGRKLSAKRNHIKHFEARYPDWEYEPFTRGNIGEAREMNDEWCRQVGCREDDGLRRETCAVEQAFRNFFELGMDGGLLRAEGKVVAFSIGDRLNETTYHVHFEKAFTQVDGAYPMINKQFAIHNCGAYPLVNREDDAGDEGLRRAKMSYAPVRILEKYSAVWKGSI